MRVVFSFALAAGLMFLPEALEARASQLRAPLKVAKLDLTARGPRIGRFRTHYRVMPRPQIRVMVVAPWCSACEKTLAMMRKNPSMSDRVDLLVIPAYEIARAKPGVLEQYRGLDVFVIDNESVRNVKAYPSFFTCQQRGPCRQWSDDDRRAFYR